MAEPGETIAMREDIAPAAAVDLAAEAAPVLVNIEIMRAFVELGGGAASHRALVDERDGLTRAPR